MDVIKVESGEFFRLGSEGIYVRFGDALNMNLPDAVLADQFAENRRLLVLDSFHVVQERGVAGVDLGVGNCFTLAGEVRGEIVMRDPMDVGNVDNQWRLGTASEKK